PQERAGGSHEPRVALLVETITPRGSVVVANTHLDASREDHYRIQEVATLLEKVIAHRPTPLIVGGDFNAEPDSAVYTRVVRSRLRDSWAACGAGTGLTYPAGTPVKRIDYLFVAPHLQCASAKVIETEVSDHRPLLVELTVR
ncbi:MAG: endonuclease/exonuclease/phosphatase family protein, partial [Thermoanaerobaculia bacterium]